MTLNILPEMGISLDTPVIIGDPTCEDNYDANFTTRRAIVWTVPFTMKCEYFGPIKTKPVIKFVDIDFTFPDATSNTGMSEIVAYVNIQPGLDANGHPTSNCEISIPVSNIFVDDDWGIVANTAGIVIVE